MPIVTTLDYASAFSAEEAVELARGDINRVANALAGAEAECVSYVAARYTLPTTGPQAGFALKQAILDVARYRLFDRRATEEVRIRYEDTIRWLRDISKGLCALLDSSGQPVAAAIAPVTASGMDNQVSSNSGLTAFGTSFEAAFSVRPLA